jgi:hypothetical protein
MAVWKAQIKVTDSGTPFDVTVTAGSSATATQTIKSQWNNVIYIRNLRVISERNDYQETPRQSFDDDTSFEAKFWLGVVFVVGYLTFVYWYVAVPLAAIIGLLWWWAKDD